MSARRRIEVCHVTSVHVPTDSRILYHECRSLARHYAVTLLCRDGGGDRDIEGVRVVTLPKTRSRIGRILGVRELVEKARALDAALYHFHDPELLSPMAALASRTGRPVIYDAHEHYPDAMDQKAWIPAALRPLASRLAERAELSALPAFAGVVAADGALERRFRPLHQRVVRLDNFPPLELLGAPLPRPEGRPTLAYVGSVSAVRGFRDMLQLLEAVLPHVPDARLLIYGRTTEEVSSIASEAVARLPEGSVEMRGPVAYGQLASALAEAHVGLSLLRPHPKYEKNVSMKVFDYMALGIPWIASDFAPLRTATRGEGGFLVTPGSPLEAADKAVELLRDARLADELGRQGRAAVEGRLNWESVEPRLLELYSTVLDRSGE